MVLSMTGFASKTITLSLNEETKTQIVMNLKSLNSRYFEATCKLPYALSHLETDFIKQLKKSLHRGHIYFTVHMNNQTIAREAVQPAMGIIKEYK